MASRFSVEAVFKAVDKMTAPITKMQNRVGKMTRSMSRGMRKVNRSIDKVTSSIRGGFRAATRVGVVGIGAVTGAVTLLLREFSKVEDAEAAFTPLLGGVKKAKELVAELNKTAASTPFQFQTLADQASQLLPVMDGNIKNTIKTLRMLGDTAGGNAQKLETITRGFTKAMLKGKVDLESLGMIAEAGVPIFKQLADTMGVKVNAAFFKMISAGKVTTRDLTKSFEKMTSEGGIFYKGMEISSRTTSGLWSTLKDNVSQTAAEIGSVLAPTIKDLIKDTTGIARRVREWVKNNRELISEKFILFVKKLKTSIAGFIDTVQDVGRSKSSIDNITKGIDFLGKTVAFLVKHGKTIAIVTASIIALSVVTKTLSAAMIILNTVVALNPFVLMVAGIALLISGIKFAYNNFEEFRLLLDVFSKSVIDGFVNIGDWIKFAFEEAFKFVKGLIGDFLSFIQPVLDTLTNIKAFSVSGVDKITSVLSGVGGDIATFFGFGGEQPQPAPVSQVVSPQERIARSIEERKTTAEVTIRDETNRAEITRGKATQGIKLQRTGAF